MRNRDVGTGPEILARLAGVATVCALLGACQETFARRDTVTPYAGEAVAYNKAVHVIDPWPAGSANTDIRMDGQRAADAIERLHKRHEETNGPTMLMLPLGKPPGAGAP